MKKFIAEQKDTKFTAINFRDNFNSILKFLDVKELTNEGNFVTDGYDIKIEGMNDATRDLADTYKRIYYKVWESIDAKTLWANGVEIQDLAKYINQNYIMNNVYKVAQSRWFKESYSDDGKKKDFLGILPTNIVPLDMENLHYGTLSNVSIVSEETGHKLDTQNLTGPNKIFTILYKDFINKVRNDKDSPYYDKSFSTIQTLMQTNADLDLINEYKIYVGQNFEKIAKQLGLDNEISSATSS